MKLVILGISATMLIAAAIIFGPSLFGGGGSGKAQVNPAEYDAGDISMEAGLLKRTYEVKNVGQDDLKIENIFTSCDCTRAIFRIADKVSPEFGMPGMGQQPILWSATLAPGEKGELEMIFDPAFHGHDALGPVARAAYLETSDLQNKKVEVRLFANVTH